MLQSEYFGAGLVSRVAMSAEEHRKAPLKANISSTESDSRRQLLASRLYPANKHLMTGPKRKMSIVSLRLSMFPEAKPKRLFRSKFN